MVEEREHTRFSPSSSERLLLCPGSVGLIARVPQRQPSRYAVEGTIAHHILETALREGCNTAAEAIELTEYGMGILEATQFEASEDGQRETQYLAFLDAINTALDFIIDLHEMTDLMYGDVQMFIEQRVNPPVASAPGEAAGYLDVALYSPSARKLWVIDYKHGAGVFKAVEGNTQLMQYGAGLLYEDNPLVHPDSVDEVVLVIVQPRAFHKDGEIRQYSTTPLALADYLLRLDEGIEAALDPNAPLIPGEVQCRFCDARALCPAAEEKALTVAHNTFGNIRMFTESKLPEPSDIDLTRLGFIVNSAPYLEAWLEKIRLYAWELSMNGHKIPGCKLVESKAKREWHDEDEHERARKLAELTGLPETRFWRSMFTTITDTEAAVVDAFKAKAKRGFKKQAAEEAKKTFAYFTTKQSSGKLSLVPESDERPPANRALQSFDHVAGTVSLPPIN